MSKKKKQIIVNACLYVDEEKIIRTKYEILSLSKDGKKRKLCELRNPEEVGTFVFAYNSGKENL